MTFSEVIGRVLSTALAPIAVAGSRLRGGRLLHPKGVVYAAQVLPLGVPLGARLAGPALVRLSSAWWKRREWKDVLGIAIRFGQDQDLLLATIRRPWTTLLAPLTTNAHDFLSNDYYGVSPFRTPAGERLELRIVTPRPGTPSSDRFERLASDVASGRATLTLEARQPRGAWRPVCAIRLEREVPVDQRSLAFSPFRDGRGLEPSGFIHALRRAVYPASQLVRA